jgi:hypothetical protein
LAAARAAGAGDDKMEITVRTFAAALAAIGFASGCVVETHHGHYLPGAGSTSTQPSLCTTSSGSTSVVYVDPALNPPTTAPGNGAGVFVEYQAGGHWRITAICDTLISGEPCTYDLWAQVIGGTVANVAGEGLGPNDLVGMVGSDTARLSVDTRTESDAVVFDAPPGATVSLTMLLGNESCVGFIFWTQGGAVRNDTNGNPVELVPTAP